jgi:hypothetical protein
MKLDELTRKYNFHDSLLESIHYDENAKTAVFEVDFCNWAQDGYTKDKPETMIVRLNFRGVKTINNHIVRIDSNGINACKTVDQGGEIALEFAVLRDYPDGDGGVDLVRIVADSVEFVADAE